MTITIQSVTPDFAAEVGDADLSGPLAPEVIEAIRQALWKYALLVFPDQDLTEESHLAFAENFGPLETAVGVYRTDIALRAGPQISDVSNVTAEGELWGEDSRIRRYRVGDRLWHTDSSFRHAPARASLLYARAVPPIGGHTEFADARAAYDALSPEMQRRLDGLVAEHSLFHSRARIGYDDYIENELQNLKYVPQAMVRTIPETGRRTLYVAAHAGRIFGMAEDAGLALIDELLDHVGSRRFVYTHRWRPGDLVIWDNRCTLHRGTEYDDLRWRRDMLRATVSDETNSCEQEGIPVPAAGL